MASDKLVISYAEISKWGQRLAADDWSWLTWKYLLGNTALILLWAVLMLALLSLCMPGARKRLSSTGVSASGGTIFSAFVFTWVAGAFAHSALFGSGPYSYWLHNLLGPEIFANVSDWTFRYLTIAGLLFN